MKTCSTCNTPLNSVTAYTRPDGSIRRGQCRKCISAKVVECQRRKENWKPRQTQALVESTGVKQCGICRDHLPLDRFRWFPSQLRHSWACSDCMKQYHRDREKSRKQTRPVHENEYMGYF